MSDEVTVEARVTDPGIFPPLFALGEERPTAMREVYRRVTVRGEPWFTAGRGGVRGELIARGWSQWEATSMLVAARGAQDAAVEAAKFSLERSRERLAETAAQLARAKRGTSRTAVGKRHGLARGRSRLIKRNKFDMLQGVLPRLAGAMGCNVELCLQEVGQVRRQTWRGDLTRQAWAAGVELRPKDIPSPDDGWLTEEAGRRQARRLVVFATGGCGVWPGGCSVVARPRRSRRRLPAVRVTERGRVGWHRTREHMRRPGLG